MVERVEVPATVTFNTEPESVFAVAEMPAGVKQDLSVVLTSIIERNGFRWESAMGHGSITGLSEKVTEKFDAVASKCDPQTCKRHIEIQAYEMDPEEVMLTVECPLMSYDSEADAQQAEEHCLQTHHGIRERFSTFVVDMSQDIMTIAQELQSAEERVRTANQQLDRLLK